MKELLEYGAAIARRESGSIRTKNQWNIVRERTKRTVSTLRCVCHGGLLACEAVALVGEVIRAVGRGLGWSLPEEVIKLMIRIGYL